MIKHISTYSPIVGLLFLLLTFLFDLPNIFGQSGSYGDSADAAGSGMHSGFKLIFGLFLYIPLLILYLVSIIRLVNHPKVFSGSVVWTFIHLLPILFFIYNGISFLEKKVHSQNKKNQYAKLAKYERNFIDSSDSTCSLIIKQNFVFYAWDRRKFAPNWPPYIETIGKINNGIFESIYNKEEISFNWDLQNMKNTEGESFSQLYRYNQINYDKNTYTLPEEFYPTLFKLK